MIRFQRLPHAQDLPLPSRATPGAAGIDLAAAAAVSLAPGAILTIPTGFAVQIPEGYVGLLRSRSGLAFGPKIDAFHGTIDCDYRGEIMVRLTNFGTEKIHLKRGTRIAQLVVVPVFAGEIEEAETLDDTQRGEGGFGSTG